MRVTFVKPWKWSDGHKILRFETGTKTVPDSCGALAIELGVAVLGKPKLKPKKEEALND